ncbi:MAG: Recombinase [Candidatus Curtissbacteria bacterium GW2011_GWC2_38_9]|uniref:Recombinase n=1 Tax=Candidatus Curtissbacteria bacterium GW2011_GWC2_38_9 TaxID=1618414 RepID=A0A0G0LFR6_9BACT|nr:MAG: Recombinase [Candidatus Curtissbacteria bacterium GW2011_GWC2_38_9]
MQTQSQKFFLYARKSTDVEDKQALSIVAQITELREYAKRESIVILEELIEKQSAKIPGRPIFNSMIERIEKDEACGILAWHPDRLARNSVDGGKIIYLIDGGKIKFLKFPQFWFDATPQGKFMLTIAFGQSKYFVDSLSENTKRGLRQKVRNGIYPGIPPVGYLNDLRSKTIVLDRKKAPIIKKAFEMFAAGHYRIMDIRDFLAKNGIVTRKGQEWKADRVTRQILTNPFYYGHFKYWGEIHEGKHEPIITKKLFDKAVEVVRQRSKSWKKPKVMKAYLGLFQCGECRMMVTAEIQKGHIYYRCTKKSKIIKCNQPYIREEEVDGQLSKSIEEVSLRQDWADEMLNKLSVEEKDVAQTCRVFVGEKQAEIISINEKLQRLLDSYLDQDIDRNTYLNKKADLLALKKKFEEQISSFQQKQNVWLEPFKNWIVEAANAANTARGEDKEAKKVLAQKIFGSNLTLKDKIVCSEALNQWAALCAAPTTRDWVPPTGVEPVISGMKTQRPRPLDDGGVSSRI